MLDKLDHVVKSEPTSCAHCGANNVADRRYCGKCGKRLWEPCGKCHQPNPTVVEFCGHCGDNLKQQFEARLAEIQSKRERSQQFQQEGRYLEAMAELRSIRTDDDTRLVAETADIPDQIQRLTDERTRRMEEVKAIVVRAEQYVKSSAFVRAYELLREIPLGLRDDQCTQLFQHCQSVIDEIKQLTATLKDKLAQKSFDGLIPIVQRLIELKPDDAKLPQLLTQLQQRESAAATTRAQAALQKAKQLFKSGQYKRAAEAIAAVDDSVIPSDTEAAYHTINEVAWCLNYIKEAPFLDRNVQLAAERWSKLRPHDATAKKLVADIKQRLAAPARPRSQALATPRNPKSPPHSIGLPLEWWKGLSQIDVAEEECDEFVLSPNRFHAALGLALQGIGRAKLQHNLIPASKGFLGSLSRLRFGKSAQQAWGLDLGSTGLKAVRVEITKPGDRPQISCATFIPRIKRSNGQDDPVVEYQDMIQRLVEEQDIEQSINVVLGLSGPQSLGRTFQIPNFKNNKKAEEAIAFETKMQIPIDANAIYYDWHAWPPIDDADDRQVTLLAARRGHVQQLIDACQSTPLTPIAVQSVCFGLYNAAVAEFFRTGDEDDRESDDARTEVDEPAQPINRGLALVELGHHSSSLVIAAPEFVRYRSIAIGTQRLDRQLVDHFKITTEKASTLRVTPRSMPRLYKLDELTCHLYSDLALDILRTLRTYESEGIELEKLIITGGAAEQIGMLRCLAGVES